MALTAKTSLEIDAPIANAWEVMLDVRAYNEWNPFIVDVDSPERPLQVGDALLLHVRWADGSAVKSPEIVTEIEAPREVDGITRARFAYRFTGWLHSLHMIRCVRIQTLESSAEGPTRYETTETFVGWAKGGVPLAKVQEGFERQASAMKRRVETGASPASIAR